jgi:hypothetical protein
MRSGSPKQRIPQRNIRLIKICCKKYQSCEIYQMTQKLLEKEFLGAANKEMHLVQDVNQVLTVLVVYMINERMNYEYRITY